MAADKVSKLVYTTDPVEAKRLRETGAIPLTTDLPAETQTIRVELDRKRRKGKTVTVASGFQLTKSSLDTIARRLKARCGAGGKLGTYEIEIQGDHVGLVCETLSDLGFRVRRINRS